MPLPDTIRVKLSTEAVDAISFSPVVVRDMPFRELFEMILSLTGKHTERIREILARGTLVNGASRFRWQGWEADAVDIKAMLAAFPDSDPSRVFDVTRCVKLVVRGGIAPVELPRAAAAERRLLRGESFWDVLAAMIDAKPPAYLEYSYREKADRYRLTPDASERRRIVAAAPLLRYSTLVQQITRSPIESVDFLVAR